MSATQTASYDAVHRYDGAVLQHDARERIVPMAIQPRDFAIVLDVWRYKFLTAPMVHELHFGGESVWPAQRRLCKLFRAGLLDRFRPVTMRGSYPWTYHLGERGHVMLRDSQVVETGWRFRPRRVHEFGHVLHDLQLSAWVLAYRRAVGAQLLSWEGEQTIEAPPQTREEREDFCLRLRNGMTVDGLRDPRERPVCPDAVLEFDRGEGEVPHSLLIEFDRTGRVDKNFEKFRRYDTFLNWSWNRMPESFHADEPIVVFVCQDNEQLDQFVHAADHILTGHHSCLDFMRDRFVARNRILFVAEQDMHDGDVWACRVPKVPRTHRLRGEHSDVRRFPLSFRS